MRSLLVLSMLVLPLPVLAAQGNVITCARNNETWVLPENLSRILKELPNGEAAVVAPNANRKTRLVRGTSMTFVEAQFPRLQRSGYVDESKLQAADACAFVSRPVPTVPSVPPAPAPQPQPQPQPSGCVPGQITDFQAKYRSLRTGYFPDDSDMEGGFKDRVGKPLRTLQDFVKGKVSYVSVAMDHTDRRLPYGTVIRIPAVEAAFGKCIEFRVVDTGDRFTGRGTDKIDICNDNEQHSLGAWTNGMADIYVVKKP